MNLKNLKIGARLGLGFGFILLMMASMLLGAMVSTSTNRSNLIATMHRASERSGLAEEMRNALLSSAISVRNMGLQSKVDLLQKDEDQAKQQRAAYLAAKKKLESAGLDDNEKALFARLAEIDTKTDAYFTSAVDLAANFNTEQASAVITQEIDPLSTQAAKELTKFIASQAQQTRVVEQQSNANNHSTITWIIAASLLLFAVSTWMAWALTMGITRPLKIAVDATQNIAQGDLVSPIAASSVNVREETAMLLSGLLEMRDSLAGIVGQVRTGAENISNGANEIAHGNNDLSARTEQQASALEETAASMEQLNVNVQHNAQNAIRANQLASVASQVAIKGGDVVAQVVLTMRGINQSSHRIADIISVIDGIAFQTNILALNAAVEAARAGEQGRGFAVVAAEVRSLAGRSAEAAKEIKSLILSSVERVEQGTAQVDTAGATMTEVVNAIKRVTDLMGEISVASSEQAAGVSQVGEAVAQMDKTTQQNAAMVEQMAAAASSLRAQAGELVQTVALFRLNASLHAPSDQDRTTTLLSGAYSNAQRLRLA